MKRAAIALAAVLLVAPAAFAAGTIQLDNDPIAEGHDEASMSRLPFAGQWWSFANAKLSQGFFGQSNFEWNDETKKYEAQSGFADNDLSPFRKYDLLIERITGTNPESAIYELHGDKDGQYTQYTGGRKFDHHVDPVEADEYSEEGVSFSWWGHCNGWAAASLAEREPHNPVVVEGIRFDVADQKGLLSEVYWSVDAEYQGKRYNDPRWREGSYNVGKDLLEKLNDGNAAPAEEYKAWYENLYREWYGNDEYTLDGDYEPSAFKGVLEWFVEDYYPDNYIDAYEDMHPHVFHKLIVTCIKNRGSGLVLEMDAGPEVWNFPAHAYETVVTFDREEEGKRYYQVSTTVYYQSDGVDESILGVVEHANHYTYELECDANDIPVGGSWTGSSVDNHPDFGWAPTYNPSGADYGENHKVLYREVRDRILAKDHKRTDSRLVTLKVNGTESDARRLGREARTLRNPLDASGALNLTASVVGGQGIDKVSYYRQSVAQVGWSGDNWKSVRGDMEHLGDGSGSSWSFEWTPNASGRYMVVAIAYDGGKLVSYDELTVQYTPGSGGNNGGGNNGGGNTGDDDQYEPNNSRSAASLLTDGSYDELVCNDDDWFKVEVGQDGGVEASISFSHAEGDLDMKLLSASSQLGLSQSVSNQESVSATGLSAGTYFVQVYGYSGAKAKYSLVVTVTEGSGGGNNGGGNTGSDDDSFEENDSQGAATVITAGDYPDLELKDDDWYRFEAASGQVTFRLEFSHAEGDLDIFLHDADGNELKRSWSATDNEEIVYEVSSATTLYLRVNGYQGAQAPYTLKISQ